MSVQNGLKNGNGCCFVGERYGCWWKDGAIQSNEKEGNSYIHTYTGYLYIHSWIGDYKAVTCTSKLIRLFLFHEKKSLIPQDLYGGNTNTDLFQY